MSLDNDPRPRRPRTSIDERSVKLVADALEEDFHATCQELFRAIGAKLCRKILKNPPQLLVAGPFIPHDNARMQIADVVTKKLRDYGWEDLPHASYSPDTSPPDFDLFPKLKKNLAWTTFTSLEELSTDGTQLFDII